MNDYLYEHGKKVDLKKLVSGFMPTDLFKQYHRDSVISCHDIFVQYNGGILLVKRKGDPAKGNLWPLGGKMDKGVPTEESLRDKVREESGLELYDLADLGHDRTFFNTDPFGHGHGTDSVNIVYFGRGKGSINLNKLH